MESDHFEYLDYIKTVFPNKSLSTINDTIYTVRQQLPYYPSDIQLQNILELLAEDVRDDVNADPDTDDNLLDEATGYSRTASDNELSRLKEELLCIFPDACPSYVQNLCSKKSKVVGLNLNVLIDDMVAVDYPKKSIDPSQIFDQLKEMLPNADPRYLQSQADSLAHQPEEKLKQFVEDAIDKNDYPTMEHFLKDQKENDEINQYTTEFNIKRFLKQFPDPETYFSDPKYQFSFSSEEEKAKEEEIYILNFLYNHYNYLRRRDIDKVFKMNSNNVFKTCIKLDTLRKALRMPRNAIISYYATPTNIPLLQEIAYLKHRKPIKKILKEYDANYKRAKEEAKRSGLLQTCACCFDQELIPEECYFCKNGCIFCKDCVKGGAEAAIGQMKLDFFCLADCGAEFSIPTLQMVLDSVVFSKMAQRKQMEEIKRANIDGLETCPFCDFATIPPADDKIFRCLNEDCKKESCRECRHISHIPLRCNEIEYDEDVKMRTYIENKMTEALLRKCFTCNRMFVKESGCNKMTCSCGAQMCYVCGRSVTDYSHFGESVNRCPLWTKDLNRFHVDAVIQGAVEAKAELGIDKNPSLLKSDPSKDLENFYHLSL